MIALEPITPANALTFRALRLRALRCDPAAFGSTYEKELKLPNEEWFRRAVRWSSGGAIGYIALDGEKPCGLVACYAEPEDPGRAHVVSMWVDTSFRRSGIGTALINGLAAWARGRQMRELKLMVTSVNRNAIAFYERMGFRMSGRTGPYPNDPAIFEHEMLLELGP
jgi:ribosomal protein S18 acetylase RimI-like enzyme